MADDSHDSMINEEPHGDIPDDTTSTKEVKLLFTKRKIKPSTVKTLPPPPPPPAPKIGSGESSKDEGWEREYQKLDQFLRQHGLLISKVDADGSCLFSSFALHFPSESSQGLREEAVSYMRSHADEFSPFVDTDAYPNGFEDYCSRMLRNTTWGGQLEIQALSQARQVNVYVFQTGDKATIKMINFDEGISQCVTVSYHDGEHYNSVLPLNSEQTLTVELLESHLNPKKEAQGYVDSSVQKPRSRKKAGLFN